MNVGKDDAVATRGRDTPTNQELNEATIVRIARSLTRNRAAALL